MLAVTWHGSTLLWSFSFTPDVEVISTNTLYELRRGEKFVWPLHFTIVVVRQPDGWEFAQVTSVHFPDERIFEVE
jgi:hypothetical protein